MNITLKTFLALSISLASSSFFERVFEMASNKNSNVRASVGAEAPHTAIAHASRRICKR